MTGPADVFHWNTFFYDDRDGMNISYFPIFHEFTSWFSQREWRATNAIMHSKVAIQMMVDSVCHIRGQFTQRCHLNCEFMKIDRIVIKIET